ncbi:hypothetical protein AB832_03510 [Flavobacteriaceae bacterium (ex Bugula neritina AB1)]|nr:hypothetical protein AB832_03510 [Flavobacteriaceae bacterium (ex Bugula neritina AB1)]
MFTLYVIAYYKKGFDLEYKSILMFLGGFIAYIITMLLVNLITQKNDLTKKSTNTVLLFAFFTALLPTSLTRPDILLANLFLTLGIICVLDLRNGKQIKSNVFDASLCIGLASLVYFWSIGFILIVFLGILFFEPKNYRNWMIPIISLITIYVLANCFTLLFYDSLFDVTDYVDTVSFTFENYMNRESFFPIGSVILCVFFFFSVYLLKFKRKSAKVKPILKLIIAQLVIAVLIIVIVPNKNTSEILFITTPLAIIGTTYLEIDHDRLIKEINIWVFLLLPFMTLLF